MMLLAVAMTLLLLLLAFFAASYQWYMGRLYAMRESCIRLIRECSRHAADLRVTMFMQFDTDHGYERHTVALNRSYCDAHGYQFLNLDAHAWDEYPPWWRKCFALRELMDDPDVSESTDVFVWMDSDAAVVQNRSFPIGKLFAKYPDTSVFGGYEWLGPGKTGMVNAGVFAIRNDAHGRAFVRQWCDQYDPLQWCEILPDNDPESCALPCELTHGPFGQWRSGSPWARGNFEQSVLDELIKTCPFAMALEPWIMTAPSEDAIFIRHMFGQTNASRVVEFSRVSAELGLVSNHIL